MVPLTQLLCLGVYVWCFTCLGEQILYAYTPNKRNATYTRAFDVGRKYAAESRNLLLRMSLLKNNVVIRDS